MSTAKEHRDAWQANQAAKGLCRKCTNPCEPGKLMCVSHNAKNAECMRKLREKRKASRKCVVCGVKARNGTRCAIHTELHRLESLERYHAGKEGGDATGD